MKFSIIIPSKNSSQFIRPVLDRLKKIDYDNFEVIVIDDGSSDNTNDIVIEYGYKVIKNTCGPGPAGARNCGAKNCNGEIILFIDTDVWVKSDILNQLAKEFENPKVDGIVGVQSLELPHNDFYSQFKNLWMNYTYYFLPERIALFYTSAAAIRTNVFLKLKGFDENYCLPSIEDTEFGHRAYENGYYIKCLKDCEIIHDKNYTFKSLIKCDYKRSEALAKYYLRRGFFSFFNGNKSSVPNNFIISVLIIPFLYFFLIGFLYSFNYLFLAISILSFILINIINKNFYRYIFKIKGPFFSIKSIVYLNLSLIIVIFGMLSGILNYSKKRY